MNKVVSFMKKVNTFFNNMADAPVEIAMSVRQDTNHVQLEQMRLVKERSSRLM